MTASPYKCTYLLMSLCKQILMACKNTALEVWRDRKLIPYKLTNTPATITNMILFPVPSHATECNQLSHENIQCHTPLGLLADGAVIIMDTASLDRPCYPRPFTAGVVSPLPAI